MTRQISLRLPDALLKRLDRASRGRGVDRSGFIREAIEAHLNGVSPGTGSRPIDRVRDLIGCVKGAGPRDLATRHSHYLKLLFRGRPK